MTVPYAFGSATTSIPLSQLDANFDTPITLGNTAIQLGNTVTTLNNMTLANATVSSGNVTVTSASLSGNLTFTGTGNRITGDFSNATTTSRVSFQSSTTNGATVVQLIPNGTSTSVQFSAYGGSDILNTSVAQLTNNGTEVRIASGIFGTGTYLPMTFFTGGSERMRIDTSGNVGIGTSSPGAKLEVKGASATAGQLSIHDGTGDTTVSGVTAASLLFQARDTSVRTIAEIDAVNTTTNGTGGAMVFQTRISDTLAERMRIDSSGNVGIGTSSPISTAKTSIKQASGGGTGSTQLHLEQSNTTDGYGLKCDSADGALTFSRYASGSYTERARITSGGEVYIAGTTDQGAYNLQCNGTGVWGAGAYVNGSDERIKEDIAPLTSGLDVVTKLNPVTYRYKEDWSKDQSIQPGFIAQEMLVAMEGQDYVDGVVSQGGAAGYYSVAYQNIIPLLTKAIQEQQQMIETLQAKVAALEGVKK